MSFDHTHDGVPCENRACGLDRDKPARVRDEYLPGEVYVDALRDQPRNHLWAELNRLGGRITDEAARQLGRRDDQPAYWNGIPQRNVIDGRDNPEDIPIPLRLVVTTNGVMLRCTHRGLLLSGPVTCNEEWAMHHIGPAEFTEAISHALGHVSIEHRT